MTTAPATLTALAAFWKTHGGVNLGIVGNKAHTTGYHLGKDRIYDGSGPGIGDSDYSVKLARDKAGLTNAASAIDLGKLNGSLPQLRSFSRDLVARCLKDAATRKDVREVIYSPDGVKVQRYSGVDNAIHTGTGNGDSSHITHTHISFFRDSQARDKRPIFAPYFATPEVPADMPAIHTYLPGYTIKIKATSNVRKEPQLSGALIRTASAAEKWEVIGTVTGGEDTEGSCTTTDWYTRWNAGQWEYTSACNLTDGPTAPTSVAPPPSAEACQPYSTAEYKKGILEGADRERERLAVALGQEEAEHIRQM